MVLDVVSWLCDGQNQEMQNLLRKQENTFSVSDIHVCMQYVNSLSL